MLKSQLQTTNFSTNFLSELPDEVQELIYRKVCMFVINELNALVRVANELKTREGGMQPAVHLFYRHPVVNNLPLNKAMVAIKIVRTLNKDFNIYKNYRFYTYYGGTYGKYDGQRRQWSTKYNCPDIILGSPSMYFDNKDEMIAVLQANNIKYYKSWTRLKLYKALMSY